MNTMESQAELEQALQQIKKWEKDQGGIMFWDKLGRIPFMILDKMTPKMIRNKLGVVLNELGRFIQSGGTYLISSKAVMQRLAKEQGQADQELTIAQASQLPLQVMNKTADSLSKNRSNWAALQGATTGIGGIFTISADIPAMIGMSLKILQEIALCYGYDPKDPKERLFIMKCLQFSSSDIVGKKSILSELSDFDHADTSKEVFSQMKGWHEVITTYRDNFGIKKLFQLIPVAGIAFGAFTNHTALESVAEAGKMLYRKRRVQERLQELQQADSTATSLEKI